MSEDKLAEISGIRSRRLELHSQLRNIAEELKDLEKLETYFWKSIKVAIDNYYDTEEDNEDEQLS